MATTDPNEVSRKKVFWYEFVFLLFLMLIGFGYIYCRNFQNAWLSSWLPLTLGAVPIGVPWYGCLGAVLFSLNGIFEHRQDWDPGYWPWYVARPFIGGCLAIVAVFMMQAGVLAVGATPVPTAATGAATPIPPNLLYYLIAFLVGYNEMTFRDMIKRLTDVILGSNKDGVVPLIQGIDPPTAPYATPTDITISGLNLVKTNSVMFGDEKASFTVSADGKVLVKTPTVAKAGAVVLSVSTADGTAKFQYTMT